MKHYMLEDTRALPFFRCAKTAPILARELTQWDVAAFEGKIKMLEGEYPFAAGDLLLVGQMGDVWPKKQAHMERAYEYSGSVQFTPWSVWRPKPHVREAYQVQEPFEVMLPRALLKGKPGDYLVRDGEALWIVSQFVFESDYQRI